MKHIHIALVLFVCSFITLSCAKSTLVYRRYHRKRPSIRKTQKNVVEVLEVFKTNRKPPAFMKSDKSIEKFLLCDSKCEKKRFLRRQKMCLRTGRFCPTRPSGSKVHPTTQINVSTRPIYNKPTIYNANPYNNRNPDYTHLYPWSRPSVTVTKYPPDGSKDFNMTIVEVNKDTVMKPIKEDYEYYDTDNDDRYQQRRSTTFRVPTTTLFDAPEPIRSAITTTSEATSQATEFPPIIQNHRPDTEGLAGPTWMPATSTPSTYFEPSTNPTTTVIPATRMPLTSTTEEITTEASTSTSTTTEASKSTSTTTEASTSSTTTTEASTSTSTTTDAPTIPSTTRRSFSTTTNIPSTTTTLTSTSTSTTTEAATTPTTEPVILTPTTISTTQNQTDYATNTELGEDDGGDVYEYEEGEGEEGAEEGAEELGEEDNAQVDADGENGNEGAYDYDDDGDYEDEEQA